MNVFQATLIFISFVAAKGSFPAVIFGGNYFLARPRILTISDTEVEVGFDYTNSALYIGCPLDRNRRKKNAFPEVLVQRQIETATETVYLCDLPFCELPPQVYYRKDEDDNSDSRFYSSRDGHAIGEVFTLNFNTATKKTISVEYQLPYYSQFISTASNQKHTFVYEKNENFLGIHLDRLYHNFIDQILPRMWEEKSKNQLAHALGIQKVQLAPQDDFALDTGKMATYWNINTVPVWRVLLLRWNAIEIYLRKVYKRDIIIKIETGVSGTLEPADRYHDNNTMHKLHIPKYVWKLIPRPYAYKKAMLIVMHNDPFTEHQQPLCADICTINGWLVSNNDYRTGLVYCCEMTTDIAQILGYSKDTKDYGIYSFTKDSGGAKNLEDISRILSDPREKLYDW